MIKRLGLRLATLILLATSAVGALGAEFTLDDLKKMVREIEAIAPKNEAYQYPIDVAFEEDDEVNAYASAIFEEGKKPQAILRVHTGLVKFCDGDARIIRAVVAHEVAHLANGHVKPSEPAARDLAKLWTRVQETEADLSGASYLERLGHANKDMVDMLLKLETLRGRLGSWLGRLTGTHPDPKARAARISTEPAVLESFVQFDVALTYMEARMFGIASRLFDSAATRYPMLSAAYVNSAQASLMNYYDNLPVPVKENWFRPDFGPLLTDIPLSEARDPEIRDSDRRRYAEALLKLQVAAEKASGNPRVAELMALAQVLEPDGKKDVLQAGIAALRKLTGAATDTWDLLRHAVNLGLGLDRVGDVQGAYDAMIGAQKKSEYFNPAIAENLGRISVKGASKETDALTADVLAMWLAETPSSNVNWSAVKKNYETVCGRLGVEPKKVEPKPSYLCKPLTVTLGDKTLGLLDPVQEIVDGLGPADLRISFDSRYPDLTEMRWRGGDFSIFTESGRVMRLTTYVAGSSVSLRPVNTTDSREFLLTVGMSEDDFAKVLNLKGAKEKDLAKGGKVETWMYFSGLNLGVMFEDGKLKGITITPAY
ncbi:MAG: M48 family metalloprotease [Fimbriimonadaceae bacterium]|nr:Beta-barrel assembly-enhancing protease [Fimbriimonadaceae bacterium]MCL4283853.1 M48 family metalloprotease [Fimbriimonadaceae bacterium]QOJ12678.1 MAG: M48 family metalloprotease [Chthonomonadaceae bacterium]